MFFEWYVRSWRYCCRILHASNGLRQLGLAKSRPLPERFRVYSIGTPVLKSLWAFRIAYFCSFPEATAYDLTQGLEFHLLCCSEILRSRCSCFQNLPFVFFDSDFAGTSSTTSQWSAILPL